MKMHKKPSTLFKHQQRLLDEFPVRHLLAWEPGTGKSRAFIELAEKVGKHSLVICPKGLKSNWRKQIEMYSDRPDTYHVMSKEEFKRDWEKLGYYPVIGVDESHHLVGMKSQISRAFLSYMKQWRGGIVGVVRVYFMTGTPYRSSPWDIYRTYELLGKRLDWWSFKNEFFTTFKMGKREIPVIRKGKEEDIAELIRGIGSTVKMADCVDVPDQTFDAEYFELNRKQKTAVKAIMEPLALVRMTKEHQICGGTLKGNEYEPDQRIECDKFDRLMELADTNDRMIVVCRYNLEIEAIRDGLKGKRDDVYIINGDVPGDERHAIVERTNTDEKYVLLVNASCSEGWEAPTCPLMVFYSYDYSLVNYVQMIARIQRINNIKKNVYLSLVVKDTVDERVFETVTVKKMDFQVQIYDRSEVSDSV